MDLCLNCGRPRTLAALRTCCVCIPAAVWREKEMITALERLDVIAVVRLLDKHLTIAELSRLVGVSHSTISGWKRQAKRSPIAAPEAIAIFENLGVPGQPQETFWQLPFEVTEASVFPLDEALATWEHARALTITAPEAVQVRVGDQFIPAKEPIAFLARDEHGLVLIVEKGTSGIADTHRNTSMVRIALED